MADVADEEGMVGDPDPNNIVWSVGSLSIGDLVAVDDLVIGKEEDIREGIVGLEGLKGVPALRKVLITLSDPLVIDVLSLFPKTFGVLSPREVEGLSGEIERDRTGIRLFRIEEGAFEDLLISRLNFV